MRLGGDNMSQFVACAVCAGPVVLGYGDLEERSAFEVEPSFAVNGCGTFE